MGKFCTKCGASVPENSKFCTKCGATLNASAISPKVAPKSVAPKTNNGSLSSNDKASNINNESSKGNNSKNTFLVGLGVVAAGILLCGSLAWYIFKPVGPSETIVKDNITPVITQYNLFVKDKFIIKEMKIQDKTVNEAKNHCELTCKVILESEDAKKEHYYLMTFDKLGDAEWTLDKCLPFNEKSWKAEPLKGVSENSIKNSLLGREAQGKYKKFSLDPKKISDIKISDHKADLASGTDVVKFDFDYKEKMVHFKMSAAADYEFVDGRWKINTIKIDADDDSLLMNKGYEFNKKEADLMADMTKSPILFKSNYGDQTISVSKEAIKNFKVNKRIFDWSQSTLTRECTFELVKKSAKLNVDAKMVYEYGASGWRLKSILYTPKLIEANMTGVWKGSFKRWGKDASLVIRIDTQDANGLMSSVVEMGPSASDPGCPSASYKALGGVDKNSFKVEFKDGVWINRADIWKRSFDGVLLLDEGKITNNNDFTLTKISD